MKRLVFFALIGGGIGAGAAYFRSDSSNGNGDASTDLTTAAVSGAAAGGLLGLILHRRAKRKTRKPKLVEYAHRAGPRVESALETALSVAEVALPKVERVAEFAREQAKERAAQARDLLPV